VLDSGDGVSHTVPVYEGFAVPNAIQRIDLAGRDVSEYLTLLLRKSGSVFQSSAEREIVRLVKEKTCYVAANVLKEEKEKIGKFDDFVLPDGKVIKVFYETYHRLVLRDFWLRKFSLILKWLD
jgi:centractin